MLMISSFPRRFPDRANRFDGCIRVKWLVIIRRTIVRMAMLIPVLRRGEGLAAYTTRSHVHLKNLGVARWRHVIDFRSISNHDTYLEL